MRMWLHIFLPSLIGIANVASEPVKLYCFEYISTFNGTHVDLQYVRIVELYPDYDEFCELQIVYSWSSTWDCYPLSLISAPELMLPLPPDNDSWLFKMDCYEYNFCTVKLEDKLSYVQSKWNITGDLCIFNLLKYLPNYFGRLSNPKYDQLKEYPLEHFQRDHAKFVFHNNHTRYFTSRSLNTTCFDLYQYSDELFEANNVEMRLSEGDICSMDVKFDRYDCTLIRVKLSKGQIRLAYRFRRDRQDEDAFTIGTWCEGDFCNRNLSYLVDNLLLYYNQTKITKCALKAVRDAINLYGSSLENVYQTHMNLPEEERRRIENRDSQTKEKDMDTVKRKPKPLIERFQPVNQELLRESDYQIEMLKKSHTWIQYTILTYTTVALVISITYGIRKKRREQIFNIRREDI